MATHDPQRLIHLLRDHLAAHDKRLMFLFGAGTSSAVNIAAAPSPGKRSTHEPLIPALDTMTLACKKAVEALSTDHARAWELLEIECAALDLKPHIENVLARLRMKVDAAGPDDKTLNLTTKRLEEFDKKIRSTIADLASPAEETIPSRIPHEDFSRWIRNARRKHPVEIFTTNYDILIERSLERLRVPLFDGFVGSHEPYFSPDAIETDETMPGYEWVRLWKLHGSINWEMRDDAVIRTFGSQTGEMILPSHRKYDESRKMPYLALMDRLATSMTAEGALIVTCGYSWNDQHINAVLLTALDNRPASHAIALTFEPIEKLPHLKRLADGRDNLMVVGPRHGLLRGTLGNWALPNEIDKATASFLDIAFDSDGLPEGEGGPITGVMRLVDFNVFCRFLSAMDPSVSGV